MVSGQYYFQMGCFSNSIVFSIVSMTHGSMIATGRKWLGLGMADI